jgi:hypothetical protein
VNEVNSVSEMLSAIDDVTTSHIDLGLLTDEEIQIIEGADDAEINDFDYPRLRRDEIHLRNAAVEAVRLVLLARGDIEWLGDEHVFQGRHAFIAEVRRFPSAMARIDARGAKSGTECRAAVYPVQNRAILVEEVDVGGLHAFKLMSISRAAEWLVEVFADQPLGSDAGRVEARLQASGLAPVLSDATSSGFFVASHAASRATPQSSQGWSIFAVDGALIVAESRVSESDEDLFVQVFDENTSRMWSSLMMSAICDQESMQT